MKEQGDCAGTALSRDGIIAVASGLYELLNDHDKEIPSTAIALAAAGVFVMDPITAGKDQLTTHGARGVRKIVLPVDDQERAKEFWVGLIGFTVVQDEKYPGGRWLEVSPPDGLILLVLSPRGPGDPRPPVDHQLPHSDVFFACADILQTHKDLQKGGVRFHTPPTKMPFGWWAMFEDPEGTRYALEQD